MQKPFRQENVAIARFFGVKSVATPQFFVVKNVIHADYSSYFLQRSALTEQYVCQELHVLDELSVCYYTNERGSCEINFIIDTGENIVPIEVKAETNLKAKSLKTYRDKFNPPLSIRTSMADFKKEDWLLNLPLYAIGQVITYTK